MGLPHDIIKATRPVLEGGNDVFAHYWEGLR
jgi:hypothetical protein